RLKYFSVSSRVASRSLISCTGRLRTRENPVLCRPGAWWNGMGEVAGQPLECPGCDPTPNRSLAAPAPRTFPACHGGVPNDCQDTYRHDDHCGRCPAVQAVLLDLA